MFKRILIVLVAAAATMAAPSIASATTAVPPLAASDTQAYLLDSGGSPITSNTTVRFAGRLSLVTFYHVDCDYSLTVVVHANGTTTVTSPSTISFCTVSIAGCSATATPNLTWGDRFVLDANGDFRDRINVSITLNFTGGGSCTGTPTVTGQLSPILGFGGSGELTMTFDALSGGLTGGPGYFVTGTLTEQGSPGGYGLGI